MSQTKPKHKRKTVHQLIKAQDKKVNAVIALLIGCIIGLLCITGFLYAATQATYAMHGQGRIRTFGIKVTYDAEGAMLVTSIDYGNFTPGESKSVPVYLINEGNTAMYLNLTASNWQPASAETFIHPSWNAPSILAGHATVQVNLTLSVDSGVTGIEDFSLELTIRGSG